MATRPNDSTPATARLDWTLMPTLCTVHSWPKKLAGKPAGGRRQTPQTQMQMQTQLQMQTQTETEKETATPLVLSCLKLIKDSSTYFISTPTGCRATRTGKCGKPKVAVDRNVDNVAVDRDWCCCLCLCLCLRRRRCWQRRSQRAPQNWPVIEPRCEGLGGGVACFQNAFTDVVSVFVFFFPFTVF